MTFRLQPCSPGIWKKGLANLFKTVSGALEAIPSPSIFTNPKSSPTPLCVQTQKRGGRWDGTVLPFRTGKRNLSPATTPALREQVNVRILELHPTGSGHSLCPCDVDFLPPASPGSQSNALKCKLQGEASCGWGGGMGLMYFWLLFREEQKGFWVY